MNDGTVLDYGSLEPVAVWSAFAGLASVPRPSFKEERVRAYLLAWARERSLGATEDSVGNIVIQVPASSGLEGAPTVVLQAHVDMVCVKLPGSTHDFDNNSIRLVAEHRGGHVIVRADGTTLGADNGIGVACALAVAVSPDVEHGPLEILLTVNEEAGMTGARAISPRSVKGRWLLNLDTEEDHMIYVGCAGAVTQVFKFHWRAEAPPAATQPVQIEITGLKGGHSGMEIGHGRANAILLMGRVMRELQAAGCALLDLEGGTKRNAIPDRASASLAVPAALVGELTARCAKWSEDFTNEFRGRENTVCVTWKKVAAGGNALVTERFLDLLDLLEELPHGVIEMDSHLTTLVKTSHNLAIVQGKAAGDVWNFQVDSSLRSLSKADLTEWETRLFAAAQLRGGAVGEIGTYPPWEPDLDSPLLARAKKAHRNVFGHDPEIATIHAGLECGLVAERIPDMQMISIGPFIEGAHTPEERVFVASVEKFWTYFTALLAELARN